MRVRLALACALAAGLAGAGPCADEARLRDLEQRRAALLASSAPKAELWSQLERKGVALKRAQELEAGSAGAAARAETERAQLAALEAQRAELARRRDDLAAALEALRAELAQAQADQAQREQTLRGFAARQRQAAVAP